MPTTTDIEVPFLEWEDFKRQFNWRQGEHVTLIGHTGSGKTELLIRLLPLRKHVVVLGTKGEDETLQQLERSGYKKVSNWNQIPMTDRGPVYSHIIVWPEIEGIDTVQRKILRNIFLQVMSSVYRAGAWCLAIDEIYVMADLLGLDGELKFLLQNTRSSRISIIGGTQRSAFIPLAFYQSSTHLFFWKENDDVNLKRISEISGHMDKRALMRIVKGLKGAEYEGDSRETLYVNTRTNKIIKTMVEL